jgi:hypothetical protein
MSATVINTVPGTYSHGLPVKTTNYFLSSAASTNATCLKDSPGTIYSLFIHNNGSGAKYLRLYDKATTPVVGTDIPIAIIQVTANVSKEMCLAHGITFRTGISFALTNGGDLTNASPVTADTMHLHIDYV